MANLDFERMAESLGGRETLRVKIRHLWDVEKVVRAGIPGAAVRFFMKRFKLEPEVVSTTLGLRGRTLERRLSTRLSPEESDRMLRLVGVFLSAIDAHAGNAEAARDWLYRRLPAFRNERPIEHFDNLIGLGIAENLLDQTHKVMKRPLGLAAGKIGIDDRFFEPLDEETLATFEGNGA